MSKFLLGLVVFTIIFFILRFFISLARNFLRIFRFKKHDMNNRYTNQYHDTERSQTDHQKQFQKDEGKYIDYEEIVEE